MSAIVPEDNKPAPARDLNETAKGRPRRTGKVLIILGSALAAIALLVVLTLPNIRRFLLERWGSKPYAPTSVTTASKAQIELAVVGAGFKEITDIQFVPGTRKTAAIAQKGGTIRIVELGEPGDAAARQTNAHTIVDIPVHLTSELGLLGLAFHPKYLENGLFYVNLNPEDDGPIRTVVSEWKLDRDSITTAKATQTRVVFEVTQPYQNHNAGQLAFGPDGMLYVGLGDGGWANDPDGAGQDLENLLGKMLRIDVDSRSGNLGYGIPKDNPFVGKEGARPEIWAYGLRNPWRYAFDPQGRLIVADVGQNEWEEVSIVTRGANLGWKIREGRHCFSPKQGCRTAGLLEPFFEYSRDLGESITGGVVYTGQSVPALKGRYLVADFTKGRMWAVDLPGSVKREVPLTRSDLLGQWPRLFSCFGRDADGEAYVGDFGSGDVLRVTSRTANEKSASPTQ